MRLTLYALALLAQTFFSETLEVRVTNIDVIVTTRDGKPVSGLTKDDFELYENGVKKEITNFLEMHPPGAQVVQPATAAAAPEPEPEALPDVRRRRMIVFIDNAGLHPHARNAILPHLQKFLEENIRGGDEITIATWNNALVTETLTRNDPERIEAAMRRLSTQTAASQTLRQGDYQADLAEIISAYKAFSPPQEPPWNDGVRIVSAYAQQVVHDMNAKTGALKSLLAAFRGAEGRKLAVIVTERFSTNPADEAFAFLDSIREDFAGGDNQSSMLDARSYQLPSLINELADVANSSGIALYPIDAGGKGGDLSSIDASRHVRVTSLSQPATPKTGIATMQAIADATGGKALTGSTNFELAFDTIATDLTTYYSLGYRSDDERQDRMKSIDVRLKKKGYLVRARRSVVEQTVSTEMGDAVAANLFRPMSTNDLKIRAIADPVTEAGADTISVPVTVTIPTNSLTLLPDGTDLTGRFSIFAAFVRNDGAVSKVTRQEQQFRFPSASLERRKEITVRLAVTTDARTDGISIGVMDEASHATGFASVKLMR
jgi:VWFA-related protein